MERDVFGNIIAVYGSWGQKVGSYCYDAWGNCTVLTNVDSIAAMNPFRYRGYYLDVETNLYYLQSRYYDAYVGRFINADGILNGNGDMVGFNMFAYCSNNPVMFTDPMGEGLISFLWHVVVTAVTYVSTAVVSLFNEEVREDMNAIGWNIFNSDEEKVLEAKSISFYKGEPVIRHSVEDLTSWQIGGFIFLKRADYITTNDVKHEWGHGVQEMIMGEVPYLLGVALPSAVNCAFGDYKNYVGDEHDQIYYSKVWERTADWFGGVKRDFPYIDFWDPINFRPW